MKVIKKLTAVLLAVALILGIAGCSTAPEWSFKTQDKELKIGVYIYSLYAAYSQAQSLAGGVDGYDSSKSFLNLEIKSDEDEAPMKASEWIKAKAEKLCVRMLAIEKLVKEQGVALTADEEASLEAAAQSDWVLGPNYQYYMSLGYTPASFETLLKPHGVSYDSFKYAYYTSNQLQYDLFLKLYQEGGDRAVSDEELKNFFEDKYTSYSYYSIPLTTSEEGEDGNSKTVALGDDEKKEIITMLNEYADAINKGEKTWAEVMDEYKEAEELESDPSTSAVNILENTSLNDDIKDAIAKLSDNKAKVVEVGSDTTAVAYLIYKSPIKDAEKDNLEDKDAAVNVLIQYKNDEFDAYIDEIAQALAYTENTKATGSYKPSMFENF